MSHPATITQIHLFLRKTLSVNASGTSWSFFFKQPLKDFRISKFPGPEQMKISITVIQWMNVSEDFVLIPVYLEPHKDVDTVIG